MAEERAARLARYAVARYGAYDVVWLVPLDGDYVQSLGEAVRAADPYGHPLGSYARAGTAPGEDPGSEGWPDLRVFRADPAEDLHYRLALQEALRWPRRPVIAEGAGDGPDAAGLADEGAVRRAAWWSLLSGAVGYTHSVPGTSAGWRRHAEPGDPHPTREEEVDVPGPRPLRRVRDLLESADWPSLEPDPDLVVNQPSDPLRHVAAARAPHLLVLYAPDSESVVVDRRRSGVFGHAILETRAEWYNPETGERFDTPYFPGGGCITFLVPRDRHRDWVLVARDRVLS